MIQFLATEDLFMKPQLVWMEKTEIFSDEDSNIRIRPELWTETTSRLY